MNDKEFESWAESFINDNQDHENDLAFLANWDKDNIWRNSHHAQLVKDFVSMKKIEQALNLAQLASRPMNAANGDRRFRRIKDNK